MFRTPGRADTRHSVSCVLAILILLPAVAWAETIAGRVVDAGGRPVAGADVLILRHGTVVATATTGSAGRYGPVRLTPGEYELRVAARGLRAEPRAVTLAGGAALAVDLTLALTAVTESIVVSASHVETALTRATDSVTVIDRADLDLHQNEAVADALGRVPGFGVVASGGRGALTSLFPRGGESDYTLVLVDGIPQNAFGGGFDAAHLAAGPVDRIEVVRGPQSALYGGGAIGGIVHVVTRRGGAPSVNALFEAGGYGTLRSAVSAAGSHRAWRWGANIDALISDGDTRVHTSAGRVSNNDYERLSGSASLEWSDRPGRAVKVDAGYGRNERGFPGPYGSDPAGLYGGLDLASRGVNQTRSVGVSATAPTGRLQHRGLFTWSHFESDFDGQFGASDDETRRASGRYQVDATLQAMGLSAGWEIVLERADNTFITGETFQPVPVERSVNGWFVEGRPAIGSRGFLTLGLRVERIERSALQGNPSVFGPRPEFDGDVVWSVNPKTSVAWFLRPPDGRGWTKLRAGAGTGIKAPTAFEIAFTDNPGLKPERSRSIDAGIEQALISSALVVDATWFLNQYDDLIVAVGSSLQGASRYRTDNIANARSHGLEVGARWRTARGVSLGAAWTWLHTEVLGVDDVPSAAPAPFKVGDPLVRRPRHQASVDVSWSSPRASAFVTVYGRGEMADIEPNFASAVYDNPGYGTVALGGSIRIARGMELLGRIANLLDRDYEEALGFPALGRSASIGIRVAASR